jgi:hypothetical protein
MACLLAEMRTNHAKIQNNREEMLAKMETNQERVEVKMVTNHEKMDATIDVN